VVEDGVVIHTKNTLVSIPLRSEENSFKIDKKLRKSNIIKLKGFDALYFWEYDGNYIEMMPLPFDHLSKDPLIKVFVTSGKMKFAKTTMIDGIEYLCICDEERYIKILTIEENRMLLHKEYFVDNNFGKHSDNNSFKSSSLYNSMLYSSSGWYSIQEKGEEQEDKFSVLECLSQNINKANIKFPMWTEGFNLYSLNIDWDENHESSRHHLLLWPQMNTYTMEQREMKDTENQEMLLHFDENFIVYSSKLKRLTVQSIMMWKA